MPRKKVYKKPSVAAKAGKIRVKPRFWAILGIIIVVVIALAYIVSQPSVGSVTQTETLSLRDNQTVYLRVMGGVTFLLWLSNVTNSSATVMMSDIPLLANPVAVAYLNTGSSVNMSSSDSRTADLNIKLVSVSNGEATLQLTPLQSGLGIGVSRSVTFMNPAQLSRRGSSVVLAISSTTTVTTTSVSTTTTVVLNATEQKEAQAISIANSSAIGVLVAGYEKLFVRDLPCNATGYDSTYERYYLAAPPAPLSFANITGTVPTGMAVDATMSDNTVDVVYSTVAPSSASTGPAIVVQIGATSLLIQSVTYTGIWSDQNFTSLNASYTFQSRIADSYCGAYVVKP